ncbi:MAG: hypothetical protein II715_05680 [Clostridia bacterium]|nr:hypothetical protein [Clostridia bacterium]
MSKRFIAILLFALMVLTAALTACGGNNPTVTNSEIESQPAQSEAQSEPAEESRAVESSPDASSEESAPDASSEEPAPDESSEEPKQDESSEEPKPDDSGDPKGYLWMKGNGASNPAITFKVPGEAIEDAPITIKALVKFGEDCQPNGGCVYLNMYSYEQDEIGNWAYLITFLDYAKDSEVEKGKWVEIDTSKTMPALNPYNGTFDSTSYGGVNHSGGRFAPAALSFGIGFYLATGTINVAAISLEQNGKTLWSVDFEDEIDMNDTDMISSYENIRPDNKGVDWDIVGGKILLS